MIKNIIKRIIVGVGIALVLSFIYNIKPKAVTKTMSFGSGNWYNDNTLIESQSYNSAYHNTPWYVVYANGNYMVQNFSYVELQNIHSSDYYNFRNHNYVSFIVYSPYSLIADSVQLTSLGVTCNTITSGRISQDSVQGSSIEPNIASFAVVECNLSGSASSGATDAKIYYSQSLVTPTTTLYTRITREWYFYDEPIADKLNTIISLLGTNNSNLQSIITLLTTNNSVLRDLATYLGNKLDAMSNGQGYINTSIQSQTEQVTEKQQATTDAVNETNNTLKDDNVGSASGITDNANKVASNNVISSLITLPITLFQNILNAITGSCVPFNLGTLFDYELIMPCIDIGSILGSTIYTIIDIICSGIFIYFTGRKMIDIFNYWSSMGAESMGDLIK